MPDPDLLAPLPSLPSAAHSRTSSTHSNASDTTFSSQAHIRHHSSNSSLSSSSPPTADPVEHVAAAKRHNVSSLPKLWEHPDEKDAAATASPVERELSFEMVDQRDWSFRDAKNYYDFHTPPEYDMRDSFYAERDAVYEEPVTKRRRSGIQAFEELADRIGSTISRFPSLSRRSRHRSSTHSSVDSSYIPETPTSPRLGRSRSNSRARSMFRRSQEIHTEQIKEAPSPHPIGTIAEGDDDDDFEMVNGASPEPEVTEPESSARVATPLLPPMMRESPIEPPIQSPLDSPAIAPTSRYRPDDSTASSPQYYDYQHQRRPSGVISPPLSQKPSSQSVRHPHSMPYELTPTSDIPPMLISDPQDELGHANFHIYPAPYQPEEKSLAACERLAEDWRKARAEFSRHLARTATHIGQSPRTSGLTNKKWAVIDEQWRENYVNATNAAVARGETPDLCILTEPAPVAKVPEMDDFSSGSKWPRIGDADIVGPMSQAPRLQQPTPPANSDLLKRRTTAKDKVLRIFSGIARR